MQQLIIYILNKPLLYGSFLWFRLKWVRSNMTRPLGAVSSLSRMTRKFSVNSRVTRQNLIYFHGSHTRFESNHGSRITRLQPLPPPVSLVYTTRSHHAKVHQATILSEICSCDLFLAECTSLTSSTLKF